MSPLLNMKAIFVGLLGVGLLATSPAQSVEDLKSKAASTVKKISELTARTNLTDSDKGLELMQQLLDELKGIRQELARIEPKKPAANPFDKFRLAGYTIFQYTSSDKNGDTAYDAFRMREIRPSLEADVSKNVMARISAELTGDTNQMGFSLRDVYVRLGVADRTQVFAGQFPLPLGYDLERSAADRETQERSIYNRALFATERTRGVKARYERDGLALQVGVGNALTVGDPEQSTLSPGAGNNLAAFASARYTKPTFTIGLSGLAGKRARYTVGQVSSPANDRRFGYLDGAWRPTKRFNLTGEVMMGQDRVPSANASATNVDHPLTGFQTQANYWLDGLNEVSVRWEQFDPNTDLGGNAVNGWELALRRTVAPNTIVTLGHEVFLDESRAAVNQRRWQQTVLRLQVRF